MSRASSLVLSLLSMAIAFCAMLLAFGESRVAADVYPNAKCATTPMPGQFSNCGCETNVGNSNGALQYACEKSFETSGYGVTLYYCLTGTPENCSVGGVSCGGKRTCTPNCQAFGRQCSIVPGVPCDNTQTGCTDNNPNDNFFPPQ